MKVHSVLGSGFQEVIYQRALAKLEDAHLAQVMNYCQAYKLPIGLLINFGAISLQFKRVYNLNHPENKSYKHKNPKNQRIQ